MSDPRLEPLDPSLQALLDGERGSDLRPDLGEVQARVRQAVQARIGGGGDGGGGDGGGAPAPSAGGPAGLAGGGAAAIGLGGTAMGLVLGVALGLGAGLPAGWMLHQWTAPVPVAVVPAEVLSPEPAPMPARPVPVPTVVPDPVIAPSPVPAPAPAPEPDFGDTEQARIDQARVALRRGRPHDALVALMSHAREYPSGQLAEERDRLTIEALVAQGRLDQAQSGLDAFRTRWPASIHLVALEALFADGGPQ